jgi:hypothetical protein
MARPACTPLAVSVCVVTCALGGCVTEERAPTDRRRAGPVAIEERPGQQRPRLSLEGPIASPALTAQRVNSAVSAVIEPLGDVPFDGLVLPLVHPDGTVLATQVGTPAAWETVLASPEADASLRSRIALYDISSAPPRLIPARLPTGVLLGRSADSEGFLVEQPLPTGGRRIGKVNWATQNVTWFERETVEGVHAHATLTPGGDLLGVRREAAGAGFDFVSRRHGVIAPGDSATGYVFPLDSARSSEAAVFALSDRGTELQVWSLGGPTPTLRARRRLAPTPDPLVAYQAMDPVRGAALSDAIAPGPLLFNPATQRMTVFDVATADLLPLADRSIAGAWASDRFGLAVLLATPEGLVHQRLVQRDGLWEALPPARLLAQSYVPRATSNESRPFVLIGPAPDRAGRRLSLIGLQLRESDALPGTRDAGDAG